jgi:exodeoxyribonuclease X
MTVRVIDIETTGTNPVADAIIEIASVDVLADGTIANRQEALVCPPIPVPPEASAVHHLTYEDLTGKPLLRDTLPMFQGADAYVAHHADFEQSFLGEHFGAAIWICTYKCALRIWPDFPSHSNQALRYRLSLANPFGIDRKSLVPHRALSDAVVTAAIFVEITKRAKWSDLVQWSSELALHTRFTFGKHRGERYDTHLDYCEWVLTQPHMDAGVRFSAEHWLEKAKVMVPA